MTDLAPSNVEAEEAILGGILIDREAVFRVIDLLKPEYFSVTAHQTTYRAITALFEKGKSVDLLTVSSYLEEREKPDGIDIRQKLFSLVDRTVSSVNIDLYVELIEEKYKRRQLIEASFRINRAAQESAISIEEILSTAENEILSINNDRVQDTWTIGDCVTAVWQEFENKRAPGYTSGLSDLDVLIGGLAKKDLIVIAGRASMGKTWFAQHLSVQVASKYKLPVVFFSAEMSKEALTKRLLASLSGLNAQHLMWSGPRNKAEWDALAVAAGKLTEMTIIIDDTPGTSLTPTSMRAVLRRAQAQHGKIGLIVLDYLQLLGERDAGNRAQNLGAVSGNCKAIAKEFNSPFIALAQLNRGVEGRNDKRPMMSDLKDSGDIEQDADLLVCLYRDEYYNDESDAKGQIELIIRKQRNGALGTAKAFFNPETGTFKSIYKK
ncbi:replicative DNA helicase [Microcoleus sp. C2C3]|uniref:replicative DNA helicase n=1 Tax=unclassified Microcoleus TaxID=2642155 RepID=UPI002FD1255B